ncbi:MAG: hypothetical protein HYV52_01725 [Parcubacteria group bacterium]|nr:hypothetical protein [Parcubacteria group bacterium]
MLKKTIIDSIKNLKFDYVYLQKPKEDFLNLVSRYLKKLKKNNYFFQINGISKKKIWRIPCFLRVLDFQLWEFSENWKINKKNGFWGLAERVKNFFSGGINEINFENFKKIISPKESIVLAKLRFRIFKNSYKWLKDKHKGDFNHCKCLILK